LPEEKQRGRLGRRLAIAIYSVALVYLVIVGFASVIPQVFWPPSDESFDLECADGLDLLRREIDELRLEYLATQETDPAPLRDALESWDLRFNALAKRCDEEQVHLLNRYRHRVELNLQRYIREDAPLARRVSKALNSTSEQPSAERSESTP
jgi:hypothetical protein